MCIQKGVPNKMPTKMHLVSIKNYLIKYGNAL